MPEQKLGVRPPSSATRRHAPAETTPWLPSMLLFWQVLTVVTGIALIMAWYSVSGKSVFDDQKTGINIAIAVLIISCALDAMFILAGRRAVGARREHLLSSVPVIPRRRGAATSSAPDLAGLVAGDGLTRYHRNSCQLAEGRDWPVASLAEHQAAGRTACGVCAP
jgi:hypothetical protein